NLFDGELEYGLIHGDTGENLPDDKQVRSKNYIQIRPNTTYTLSGYRLYPYFYNENKEYISNSTNQTFTTPSDCYYIRFRTAGTESNDLFANIQIEKGDTATEYEPYKEDISYVIAKDKDNKIVNLRSLPNGIKDEVDLEEQKVIIKTKEFTVEKEDIKNFTTGNNRNTVFIRKPLNSIGYNNTKINWAIIEGLIEYEDEGTL